MATVFSLNRYYRRIIFKHREYFKIMTQCDQWCGAILILQLASNYHIYLLVIQHSHGKWLPSGYST